jgi:hypothetical protein
MCVVMLTELAQSEERRGCESLNGIAVRGHTQWPQESLRLKDMYH